MRPGWDRPIRFRWPRAHELAVAAVLTAVVVALFHRALLGRGFFYERDIHYAWHPQVEAFVRAVAAGSWPVWNPWISFGQPLLANPNYQVLYPPTWLNLVMRPWTYYTAYVAVHAFFSGWGLYLLARRLGLGRAAGVLGAAVWMASGPVVSLVNLWNHLAGASWIPWMVWAALRTAQTRTTTSAAAWALATAAPVLAGSPDMALLGAVPAATVFLGSLSWKPVFIFTRANLQLLKLAGLQALVAAALAAGQWLPSLEVTRRSIRSSLPEAHLSYWSVHPFSLLEAMLPLLLHKLPLRADVRGALFEWREPFLFSLYLGMPAAAFVAAAFGRGAARQRTAFALVGLFAALIALGRHSPVHGWAVWLLPPLRMIRFPSKAMVLVALSWALLAAIGFERWHARRSERRGDAAPLVCLAVLTVAGAVVAFLAGPAAADWGGLLVSAAPSLREALAPLARQAAWSTALCAAALVLMLAGRRRGRPLWAASAVAALSAVDLVSAHARLNDLAPSGLFAYRPEVVDALKDAPPQRVYVYDYSIAGKSERYLRHVPWLLGQPRSAWPHPWIQALSMRKYGSASLFSLWSLEGSFDSDLARLQPVDLYSLTALLLAVEDSPAHVRLIRTAAVSRVVSLHTESFPGLASLAVLPSLFPEPIQVLGVPDALPRTYAVGSALAATGPDALATLIDPAFDPTRQVVLPEAPRPPASDSFRGRSRLVGFRPDHVRLEAELSEPGYVVLVDAFDPGWKATLDGRAVPVLPANLGFRAVAVPAGTHVIEYFYRPRAVQVGLALSALGLLAVVLLLGARRAERAASPAVLLGRGLS